MGLRDLSVVAYVVVSNKINIFFNLNITAGTGIESARCQCLSLQSTVGVVKTLTHLSLQSRHAENTDLSLNPMSL